jgi:hypothetical protein
MVGSLLMKSTKEILLFFTENAEFTLFTLEHKFNIVNIG